MRNILLLVALLGSINLPAQFTLSLEQGMTISSTQLPNESLLALTTATKVF
jgi:hypothetical protein